MNILALVVEVAEPGQDPDMVGVAQYFKDLSSNFADVAFIVADEWQGHGLGSVLFQELARLALENGVRGFTADVLFENRIMLHVFQKSGLEVKSSQEDGVYRVKMPFHAEKRL